jgi:dGTPase
MYRHPRVMVPMGRAQVLVTELFSALSAEPDLMPADWTAQCGSPGDAVTGGVVRDYIAGMTDRFAMLEYGRIFHTDIEL